ncbi:hypothetical protein GCM10007898_43700 [Dyella flagellata]|uniref:Uncharacterized protein n=1 Tax=Dyella flagellata TaxID=1867833 RepID=A0ABQ5XGG4_9GAMM|nr:hypothetical protein GCM10007898_43700 [Dyella flagellata]
MSEQVSPSWVEKMSTRLAVADGDLRVQWINPAQVELLGLGLPTTGLDADVFVRKRRLQGVDVRFQSCHARSQLLLQKSV